jgi:hypothetical protein
MFIWRKIAERHATEIEKYFPSFAGGRVLAPDG